MNNKDFIEKIASYVRKYAAIWKTVLSGISISSIRLIMPI